MADETHKNEVDRRDFQAPFALLNKFGSQLKRFEQCQLRHLRRESVEDASNSSQVVSALSIMSIAEMILSKSTCEKTVDVSSLVKACGFDSSILCRHAEHLKRVLRLIRASEKFSERNYDEAEELLLDVLSGCSDVLTGHPIETVLALYARHLNERIDLIRGRIDLEREVEHIDVKQALIDMKVAVRECEQKLPCSQISHFTGIQAVLETVAAAERIHFIDFGQKIGSYWILMIDALARRKGCPVKQLRISAVYSHNNVEEEETGKLLSSFAESMNLPFVFKNLYSEYGMLEKGDFQLEGEEMVVVYMEFFLVVASLSWPWSGGPFIRGLKDLNPSVIVVIDVEADIKGASFAAQFKEALVLSSAVFDCLRACLGEESQYRDIVEKLHFQEVIWNGALSEEDGGCLRKHNRIGFWREYFSGFGIEEVELSQVSLYQASLMIRECGRWGGSSLEMNGKSLVIGWNGVPERFVSAWKFKQDCG